MVGARSRTEKSPDAASTDSVDARAPWRRALWPESRRGRWLRGVAAILLFCGAGAAVAPWTVSRGALREEIAGQLRSSTGLYFFTSGAATFSLLPNPQIRLERISFVDPRGALVIEAEHLAGQVRLLPLLAGRLEITSAELLRPRLTVDIDGRPMTSAGAVVRAAEARAATPEAAKADRARLGIVTFIDGEANLRRAGKTVDTLQHIDATLDWRTVASPASLDGETTWRGQRAALSLWLARPTDLLRGERSPLTLQIKSAALALSANGSAAAGPRPQFEGRVVASTNSVRDLVTVAGGAFPLAVTLGAASLDAKADASLTGVNFAGVRLKLDGAEYEGSLSLRGDEARPQLSGTLAAATFDLGEALRYMQPLIGADGHFSREPIVWRDYDALDLDLRLSATRATFDRLQAKDVAGAILMTNGRLEASLADATIYKGQVKARLVLAPGEQGRVEMKGNLQGRGVDWGALGWDRFGDAHVGGTANLHLTLEGAGGSLDQIARSLTGHGDVDLTNGDIIGLDVERALKRIENKPLASAGDIRNGRTPYDKARISADIKDGVATIADGAIEGEGYAMALSGAAQIAERQIDLRAIVTATDTEGQARPNAPGFAFDVSGGWDRPSITPDARSLIKRSGAAQRLFAPRAQDAAKDISKDAGKDARQDVQKDDAKN